MELNITQNIKSGELILLDGFLHIFMLLLFLTLFFVIILSKIEKEELKKQVSKGVESSVDELFKEVGNSNAVKNAFRKIDPELSGLEKIYEKSDSPSDEYNNGLIRDALIMVTTILVGFIMTVLILKFSAGRKIPLLKIIIANIALFSLLVVIEFVFFMYISRNYVPVKPSVVIERTIKDIRNS